MVENAAVDEAALRGLGVRGVVKPTPGAVHVLIGPAAEAAARERLRGLLGRDGDFETLNAALCDGLRAGEIALDHPGLMDHLKRSAAEQVGIDQPGYSGLKALLGEPGGG